jgi:hypothetical protein
MDGPRVRWSIVVSSPQLGRRASLAADEGAMAIDVFRLLDASGAVCAVCNFPVRIVIELDGVPEPPEPEEWPPKKGGAENGGLTS